MEEDQTDPELQESLKNTTEILTVGGNPEGCRYEINYKQKEKKHDPLLGGGPKRKKIIVSAADCTA